MSGLRAVPKKKHPLLSSNHKKARMDFALAHENWSVDDWKRIIWSDETKINHCNGRVHILKSNDLGYTASQNHCNETHFLKE